MLVFDFDNFTPDDFIGSAEINLSVLKRGETVDTWVDLENVKTGQIHLQFHRSILTSPSLNAVVTSLMELVFALSMWLPQQVLTSDLPGAFMDRLGPLSSGRDARALVGQGGLGGREHNQSSHRSPRRVHSQ